jgi:hypothetical protein
MAGGRMAHEPEETCLAVPEFFNTIEQTGLSVWLRGGSDVFGFYLFLLFHAFGLALVVGANAVVDLCILGAAADLPLKSLKWLFTVMWTGFWMNFVTGIFLLIAYPTKAFTNPVFYVKLTFIAFAVMVMQRIKTQVFDANLSNTAMIAAGKGLAKWSLFLWTGAITMGRLLAYTYTYLLYGVLTGGS